MSVPWPTDPFSPEQLQVGGGFDSSSASGAIYLELYDLRYEYHVLAKVASDSSPTDSLRQSARTGRVLSSPALLRDSFVRDGFNEYPFDIIMVALFF